MLCIILFLLTLSKESGSYLDSELLSVIANAPKGKVFIGWFVQGLYFMIEGDMGMPSGSFNEDYYEYGEYWGNRPVYDFNLYDRYDEVIITAVFEEIDVEKDYIDKKITIQGWVKNHRKQAHFGFIDLYDGTSTITCKAFIEKTKLKVIVSGGLIALRMLYGKLSDRYEKYFEFEQRLELF